MTAAACRGCRQAVAYSAEPRDKLLDSRRRGKDNVENR